MGYLMLARRQSVRNCRGGMQVQANSLIVKNTKHKARKTKLTTEDKSWTPCVMQDITLHTSAHYT